MEFSWQQSQQSEQIIKTQCKEMCEMETAQHSQNPASTEKFVHYNINNFLNCYSYTLFPLFKKLKPSDTCSE
jgi:hypothetical protein